MSWRIKTVKTFSRSSVIVLVEDLRRTGDGDRVCAEGRDVGLAELPLVQHLFEENEAHDYSLHLVEAYGRHGPIQIDYARSPAEIGGVGDADDFRGNGLIVLDDAEELAER